MRIAEVLDRFVAGFNDNSLDEVMTFFAEDAVYRPEPGAPLVLGAGEEGLSVNGRLARRLATREEEVVIDAGGVKLRTFKR